MNSLELLCSPFRTVKEIILLNCSSLLKEEHVKKIEIINVECELDFLNRIKINSKNEIDFTLIVPTLDKVLKEEYYAQIINNIPKECMTLLQNKLIYFSREKNKIDWKELLFNFNKFKDFARNYSKIGNFVLPFIDRYITNAFTDVIIHLNHENLDNDENYINQLFEKILEQIYRDKHTFQNLYDNSLIEAKNISSAINNRHKLESLVRQLKNYPKSLLTPSWTNQYDTKTIIKEAKTRIKIFKEIEKTIDEYSIYNGEKAESGDQKLEKQIDTSLQPSFRNMFDSEDDCYYCLYYMNNVGLIDKKGRHTIKPREKSRLMALVEALQQKSLLPIAMPLSEITKIFALQIDLPYKRARSEDRKNYDGYRNRFLSHLNAISMLPLKWSMLVDKIK